MTYTIVVGIDGSAHGDAALRWALAKAEAHDDGRVTAVSSWQLPFVGFPGAFDRTELEQSAKDFVIERVSALVPTRRQRPMPGHAREAAGRGTEGLGRPDSGHDTDHSAR